MFRPFVPAMVWAAVNPANLFASIENVDRTMALVGLTSVSSLMHQHLIGYADPEQWINWSGRTTADVLGNWCPKIVDRRCGTACWPQLEPLREADGALVMVHDVRYTLASHG